MRTRATRSRRSTTSRLKHGRDVCLCARTKVLATELGITTEEHLVIRISIATATWRNPAMALESEAWPWSRLTRDACKPARQNCIVLRTRDQHTASVIRDFSIRAGVAVRRTARHGNLRARCVKTTSHHMLSRGSANCARQAQRREQDGYGRSSNTPLVHERRSAL